MAWRTIIDADVLDEFTDFEKKTLNGIQGGASQLSGIITRVIRAARGSIAASGNPVDQDETLLPDAVINWAIDQIRWRWLVSFPQLKSMQTAERKAAADDAQKRFDNLAETGRPKIEAPPNPSGTTLIQRPYTVARDRNMTPEDQDGL